MKKTNILMCKPTFFNVDYVINPWMTNQIKNVNSEKAFEQWNKLYEALSKFASIELIEPIKDLPDMVFTANAGIVCNNTFIVSNFLNGERKSEEIYFENFYKEKSITTKKTINCYEGEGDHLLDSLGRHWLGTGFRTDKKVKAELEHMLDHNIICLELVDARWYHLDTCFCPLNNNSIYWYPDAFSKNSQEIILNSFNTHIFAQKCDALSFSCNSICLDDTIFMPNNNYSHATLQKMGYNIQLFDLSEFIKAGGAAKCLTLLF